MENKEIEITKKDIYKAAMTIFAIFLFLGLLFFLLFLTVLTFGKFINEYNVWLNEANRFIK